MPDNLPEALLTVQTEMSEFIKTNFTSAHTATDVRQASKAAGFFYKTQPEEFGGKPESLGTDAAKRDAGSC